MQGVSVQVSVVWGAEDDVYFEALGVFPYSFAKQRVQSDIRHRDSQSVGFRIVSDER